jgi:hypothetical protein
MTVVLMVIGTIAWAWKGYTELGIILMIWAVYFETSLVNAKLMFKFDVSKLKDILKRD